MTPTFTSVIRVPLFFLVRVLGDIYLFISKTGSYFYPFRFYKSRRLIWKSPYKESLFRKQCSSNRRTHTKYTDLTLTDLLNTINNKTFQRKELFIYLLRHNSLLLLSPFTVSVLLPFSIKRYNLRLFHIDSPYQGCIFPSWDYPLIRVVKLTLVNRFSSTVYPHFTRF